MATVNGLLAVSNATVGNKLESGVRTWYAYSDPAPTPHSITFDFVVDFDAAEVPLSGPAASPPVAVDSVTVTDGPTEFPYYPDDFTTVTSDDAPVVGDTVSDGQTWSITVTIDPTGATVDNRALGVAGLYTLAIQYGTGLVVPDDSAPCAWTFATEWPIGSVWYFTTNEWLDGDLFIIDDPVDGGSATTVIVPIDVVIPPPLGTYAEPPYTTLVGAGQAGADIFTWGTLTAPWSADGDILQFDPADGDSYRLVTTFTAFSDNGFDPDVYPDSCWQFTWTVDLRGNYVAAGGLYVAQPLGGSGLITFR